jgi:hypothetical protein
MSIAKIIRSKEPTKQRELPERLKVPDEQGTGE